MVMRTDEAGDVGAPHLGRALWCRRLWVPAADGAEDVRLLALIAPQIFIQVDLYEAVIRGRSQSFLVFGLLCTAIAIGHSH
eukprot:jgi/Mesen1/4610/ME000234S03861